MSDKNKKIAIIGGGIVGTAAAMAITQKNPGSVILFEAEKNLAFHQTGHNSGVIHSGLYYKPGSLKAKNCALGREALYKFCIDNNIKHERCGKIVVATDKAQIPALDELERRGRANGLIGIRRLNAAEIKDREPYVSGIDGLLVPETGIVDYTDVTNAYAKKVKEYGGEILTSTKVQGIYSTATEIIVKTTHGDFKVSNVINCAGLQSDRVARMCGVDPGLKIVPFRGEYYEIHPEKCDLVKNLIYPVPDPRFPFLGVHFTRMIKGGREAGPNAVLSFKREGYGKFSFSLRDAGAFLTYPGFWKMSGKFWRTGFGEMYRSLNKKAFLHALQKLIPALKIDDLIPGGSGVRAQALLSNGELVDDFRIIESPNMVHVLNAPSPAATSSINIGNTIADIAKKNFG